MDTLYKPLLRRASRAYQFVQRPGFDNAVSEVSAKGERAEPGMEKQVRMLLHALSSRPDRVLSVGDASSNTRRVVWVVDEATAEVTEGAKCRSPISL
uniref:Expressed protein n=3 Tax=Schizophyllum commune (strain H4-8 / FGSC 9210) TaxID=578458 RepID=D8Q7Y9_SCHCM